MAELEPNTEYICSPADGTWTFGEALTRSYGKSNCVVYAGDEIGTVNRWDIRGLYHVNNKSTPVIATKRGYVLDVLARNGLAVTTGTPLLLLRILNG